MSSADFQAAQQRIAARRQAHSSSTVSQPRSRPFSPLHKHLSHLPPSLNRIGRAGISLLDTVRGRSGTNPAFRVGQVDAELLDEELLSLLHGQIRAGLKHFGDVQEEWGEEIGLALRGILFKVSVWDHGIFLPLVRRTQTRKMLTKRYRRNLWRCTTKPPLHRCPTQGPCPSTPLSLPKSTLRPHHYLRTLRLGALGTSPLFTLRLPLKPPHSYIIAPHNNLLPRLARLLHNFSP